LALAEAEQQQPQQDHLVLTQYLEALRQAAVVEALDTQPLERREVLAVAVAVLIQLVAWVALEFLGKEIQVVTV
jgi:hypothetical protein